MEDDITNDRVGQLLFSPNCPALLDLLFLFMVQDFPQ